MTPLAELIAYHRQREKELTVERDRSIEMPTEADQKRCYNVWERERRRARDTASWLETISAQKSVDPPRAAHEAG